MCKRDLMGEAPVEGGREEAGRAFRSQSQAAPGSGRGREEVGGRSPQAKADRQRGPHGNGSTLASMYPHILSLGCEWPKGSMALAQIWWRVHRVAPEAAGQLCALERGELSSAVSWPQSLTFGEPHFPLALSGKAMFLFYLFIYF